ncbi:MAG: OmpA family protein [Prolixibacteraceae bacterium]|nr:OmpA family protein [Prolixibacteraceae bacterium]
MKKLLSLLLLIAYVTLSSAQTYDRKWSVGIGTGSWGTFGAGVDLNPELYISAYLNSRFDLMSKSNLGIFDSKLSSSINLVFKQSDESKKFKPYLYAGPGLMSYGSEVGLNFDVGVGTKYYFNPATAFYMSAGYVKEIKSIIADNTKKNDFWELTVGLQFDFGKTHDSDMDGIPDKKDKCPDTSDGVSVDANGCPIDSDGDGVFDYIDDCPTDAGLTSLKRCPETKKVDESTDPGIVAEIKVIQPETNNNEVTNADHSLPITQLKREDNASVNKLGDEVVADQIIIQKIKTTPVHFVSGKSYLTDYSKGILDKLIKTLNSDQDYKVNMFGYSDSQGADEDNVNLSRRRIDSVIVYLTSNGISANRIIHQKTFGESNPIASNDTEEGRLKNRRVEFEIFKMK